MLPLFMFSQLHQHGVGSDTLIVECIHVDFQLLNEVKFLWNLIHITKVKFLRLERQRLQVKKPVVLSEVKPLLDIPDGSAEEGFELLFGSVCIRWGKMLELQFCPYNSSSLL